MLPGSSLQRGGDGFRLVSRVPAEVALSSLCQARRPFARPFKVVDCILSPVISSACGLSAPSELVQGGHHQDVPQGARLSL